MIQSQFWYQTCSRLIIRIMISSSKRPSLSLFEIRSMDFLGIDLPHITGFMETEIPEVETHDDMMDLTFRLEDTISI